MIVRRWTSARRRTVTVRVTCVTGSVTQTQTVRIGIVTELSDICASVRRVSVSLFRNQRSVKILTTVSIKDCVIPMSPVTAHKNTVRLLTGSQMKGTVGMTRIVKKASKAVEEGSAPVERL